MVGCVTVSKIVQEAFTYIYGKRDEWKLEGWHENLEICEWIYARVKAATTRTRDSLKQHFLLNFNQKKKYKNK